MFKTILENTIYLTKTKKTLPTKNKKRKIKGSKYLLLAYRKLSKKKSMFEDIFEYIYFCQKTHKKSILIVLDKTFNVVYKTNVKLGNHFDDVQVLENKSFKFLVHAKYNLKYNDTVSIWKKKLFLRMTTFFIIRNVFIELTSCKNNYTVKLKLNHINFFYFWFNSFLIITEQEKTLGLPFFNYWIIERPNFLQAVFQNKKLGSISKNRKKIWTELKKKNKIL